ncbi:hypothetical protein L596_001977 [Steinernema carpocapsae]|uniref:Uncharacterized protein n=1 Tax=Steinernema carpocapsae TaxID=34508 RepID=A0A4U8UPV5_STECR|nr:hypothetical protein L596_001977 [Steinernema carpocapsae]
MSTGSIFVFVLLLGLVLADDSTTVAPVTSSGSSTSIGGGSSSSSSEEVIVAEAIEIFPGNDSINIFVNGTSSLQPLEQMTVA